MSASLVFYQSPYCPYCHRVRRYLEQAGIDLPTRDVTRDPQARSELVAGGGSAMVPCLRIEEDGQVRWMYESLDIIDYLRQVFESSTTQGVPP
jgi:glutaredoxin